MFTLEFLPAKHGDCILVRWGEPARVMVVDGGPDGVYEGQLRPRLVALPPGQGGVPAVDVLCLSHVDEDHVVGIARMLKEIRQAKQDHLPLPFVVRRVWFNSLDDLIDSAQPGLAASVRNLMGAAAPDAVVSASYGQGDDVRNSVAALGLGGNQPFGSLLKVGSVETLWGLDVNVVGPSGDALAKLSKEWAASVKAKDAKAVAANYADRKVQNLSSIALHLRYGGRTALLTGDARGDHVLLGLEAAGLLAPGGTIHVDVLKLPHHGSENNAAPSMFERIRADHYVVCADGIKHKHPSTATLEWLVASRAPNEIYTIHLTNHIPDGETTLTKIAMGRSFVVAVGAPRVEIALTDVP